MSIAIIDYGMGNIGSIKNMLKKIGFQSQVVSTAKELANASKLILPGVGSFDKGMEEIAALGFTEPLNKKVLEDKTPILGICLGMQMLTRSSEEGHQPGFGWIEADTIRFNTSQISNTIKIPHMGWNTLSISNPSPILANMEKGEIPRFYFVHSYHVVCDHPQDVLGTTNYGYEFASLIGHENILGAQFHPEKSHSFGMKILKNFAELY